MPEPDREASLFSLRCGRMAGSAAADRDARIFGGKYYPSAIYDFEHLDVTSDADAANPYREAVLPALSNALYKMRNKNRRETDDPFLDLPNLVHDTCPGCGTSVAEWVVVCPGCGAHIVRGATPEELASFGTVVFFLALMFFCRHGALPLSRGCPSFRAGPPRWCSRRDAEWRLFLRLVARVRSRRVRGADYLGPLGAWAPRYTG